MPKRTYSHIRPERGPEPTLTPPERLSAPEEPRLRSVAQGGPSDLDIFVETRRQELEDYVRAQRSRRPDAEPTT